MKRAAQSASSRIGKSTSISGPGKLREVMVIAEEQGLLRGERNQVVRGRMPKALVAQAKKRTGVVSETTPVRFFACATRALGILPRTTWFLSPRNRPCSSAMTITSRSLPGPLMLVLFPILELAD